MEAAKNINKPEEDLTEDVLSKAFNQGIPISNAGLVILNSYYPMLFERLGIIENNAFKSNLDRLNAVHYFQYAATGLLETEAYQLVLNKVFCNIPLEESIPSGIVISEENKELINGLIKAVISYWSAIGDTSINGFRSNWLVREGILYEKEAYWELTVEKRAYDILLNQCPFSFSIIKFPWMSKPIHVNWIY